MWKYYAIQSALFAALNAIFAKVGVRTIDSDLATAIRTTIILLVNWGIALIGHHTGQIRSISGVTCTFSAKDRWYNNICHVRHAIPICLHLNAQVRSGG